MHTNRGSTSQEKLAAANCILFMAVATVSVLAQLAVQLGRALVFTALAQEKSFQAWGYLVSMLTSVAVHIPAVVFSPLHPDNLT